MFVCLFGRYPTPTLQWYKDGAKLDGETDSSFIIAEIGDDDEGTYTVVFENYCKLEDPGWACKLYSADAVLRINRPPSVIKSPENTTVDPGENLPCHAIDCNDDITPMRLLLALLLQAFAPFPTFVHHSSLCFGGKGTFLTPPPFALMLLTTKRTHVHTCTRAQAIGSS